MLGFLSLGYARFHCDRALNGHKYFICKPGLKNTLKTMKAMKENFEDDENGIKNFDYVVVNQFLISIPIIEKPTNQAKLIKHIFLLLGLQMLTAYKSKTDVRLVGKMKSRQQCIFMEIWPELIECLL